MKHPAGGTGVWLQTDDVVISLNQWHHVAVTYSGSDTRMRIYIDGALKDATHLRNAVPAQISQEAITLPLDITTMDLLLILTLGMDT